MKPLLIFSIALLCCATASAQPAPAPPQQWGTIYGRIVYDGPAPKPKMLTTYGKLEPNGPKEVPDESLVVGKQGGLANVFVYVRSKPSVIHPDYEKTASQKRTFTSSKNFRFEPHVLALWTHDELELVCAAEIPGNNFKYDSPLQAFNILIYPGKRETKKFALGERLPHRIASSIYPWMKGELLVRDTPYFAVTNERGSFCIPNLPAGEDLEFVFWHERVGYLKNIKSDVAAYSTDGKGLLKTKLTQPVTDFGEYRIDPAMFKEQE